MKYAYPFNLSGEEGDYLVTFPDVPEALTGDETRQEALALADDCLMTALGGYVKRRMAIPKPSRPDPDQYVVTLPALVCAKLALYEAMRETDLSALALSKRLDVSEKAMRRMLDLTHASKIGKVEHALAALGKRLVVDVQAA